MRPEIMPPQTHAANPRSRSNVTDVYEPDQKLDAEAAAWVVRLQSPSLAPDDARAFDIWRRTSGRHQIAFDRASDVWRQMGHLNRDEVATTTVSKTASLEPPASRSRRSRLTAVPRRRALAAGMLAAAAVLLGVIHVNAPLDRLLSDHATGAGEVRSLAMADGSRIDLDAGSAVRVRYGPAARRIELMHGEAAFSVEQDPARPFIVRSGPVDVQALGTKFIVKERRGATQVTVTEHSVRVSLNGDRSDARRSVVVARGETLRIAPDGAFSQVTKARLDHIAAKQRGLLVFDRQPLGDVVADLDRQTGGRTLIIGSDLAGRIVTGTFRLKNKDHALDRIARELRINHVFVLPGVSFLID
jgi:transmembrane sensor